MSEILIIEADQSLREALAEALSMAGHIWLVARDSEEALKLLDHHHPALILTDQYLEGSVSKQFLREVQRLRPGLPVILMNSFKSVDEAMAAMRLGVVDYIQKPFNAQTLMDKISRYLAPAEVDESQPVAQDPKSQALLSMALRVAQSEVSVLISGESGTGKEVLAHFIHDHSPRKNGPYIAINCAAIPEQMLEATLFGYDKGAFTGAIKASPGKFEQAQGGSLLLDEVSEMPLNLQAKLLRVLQEREVERIGSNKMISLDVRILATTNRDLQAEVEAGRFREDLYYRINVFPLRWMPLRERIHDIIPLANYLLRKHCDRTSAQVPQLSDRAQKALLQYPWPGNARELDNVIQRALVLQSEGLIEPEHLHLSEIRRKEVERVENLVPKDLQHHEFDLIAQTLQQHGGNRAQVAALLGVSERTLRYKLAKMREEGYVV